jgi:iron complex outermembrane receptor protein
MWKAVAALWSSGSRLLRIWTVSVVAGLAGVTVPSASAQTLIAQDLKRLSLEELLEIETSTVLRVPEPTTAIPAAIFVITQDDIRRSGATSLPDALRLAPGLQVAQQDAARYAIGTRGFADRLARSMLVLMDGRAVYSPLFAGTYWEAQDTMLEDIDRIEVIRGPGGTLWGANAVNGIINIITKRAEDTQGALVSATLGSNARGPLGVRYGAKAGSNGHVRVYARAFERDPQFDASAADYDGWSKLQGGVRGDWTLGRLRTLTLQSDVYEADLGQRYSTPLVSAPFTQTSTRSAPLSGANVLGRLILPAGSGEYQLQTYYDRTDRDERPVAETRNTLDIDFQHRRRLRQRHGIVWGAGYRVTSSTIAALAPTAFDPPTRTDNLFTAFLQDDLVLKPERVRLVVGTKVEHNDYSGFEIQPSARVMWTINATNSFFSAVTRAVRTPSRVETDYTTTSLASPAVPAFVRLQPNQLFRPEELRAYELGYRVRTIPSLYVTASLFFNHLRNTVSTELLTPFAEATPPPARVILPVTFANGLHGNSHGAEVTADIRPVPWWRWTANYSLVRIQMTRNPGSNDVSQQRRYEGLSPQHQVQLTSSLDLPRQVAVDGMFRYISALPAGPAPSYATSSVRVSWQAGAGLELAVVGQNLHDPRHLEWPTGATGNIEIARSAHVSMIWRR